MNNNRVLSGRKGGQYTYKVHSEQELDLIDDETLTPKQYYLDLETRSREADRSFRQAMRKAPTFDTFREQFEENKDVIREVLSYEGRAYGDDLSVPGLDFQHMIDVRLQAENPPPKEMGGLSAGIFHEGEYRSTSAYSDYESDDEANPDELHDRAMKNLGIKLDKRRKLLIEKARQTASNKGAGCAAAFKLSVDKKTVELEYVEVIHLSSRRSDFVENHHGDTAIAEGWL